MHNQFHLQEICFVGGLIWASLTLAFGGLFTRSSKEDKFWRWFEKNEDRLHDCLSNFRQEQPPLFDSLHKQLTKVHPGLMFEFGLHDSDKFDFTISADGLHDVKPAVEALCASAPDLPRWNIIAFRPRRDPVNIRIDDVEVAVADVEVSLGPDGDRAELAVYIKRMNEKQPSPYVQAAFLMLDHTIGEYDIMTKVAGISFLPGDAPRVDSCYSLKELPAAFDALFD
ncbi:hypothetical protein GF377_08130 [candidate division GN15 bacterium]|nr:hypothetical protein [candidate division GN15 bacterium]